jgi:xanthine dehydrogenase YagS FAD-binding subunit
MMQTFDFQRPTDVSAAVGAASRSPTAQQGATVRFLAGGTTLLDLMKLGVETPDHLVDINRLGLDAIERHTDGGLRIGATARNSVVAHHPVVRAGYAALSEAILSGASTQLRNAATTAGNLLQRTRCVYFRDTATPCNKREPDSGCSAIGGANRMLAILGASDHCIASNTSDMAVAMLAYDALIHIKSPAGDRQVPVSEFYLLPGDRPDRENVLGPGDLITYVTLPPAEVGARATYLKLRDRASYEFALVSAAVSVVIANGTMSAVRFALGGVGTKPWRVPEAEAALLGQPPGKPLFEQAADIALAGARPQSQNGFKVELARRCLVHALLQVTA